MGHAYADADLAACHLLQARHPLRRGAQALTRIEANRGGPMWSILFNNVANATYSGPQDILDAVDAALATRNPIRFLQVSVWIHLDPPAGRIVASACARLATLCRLGPAHRR